MTVFFILLRSPPFSKEKMPPPAYLFLANKYLAMEGELAACGFFWVVRRHGGASRKAGCASNGAERRNPGTAVTQRGWRSS